MDTINKQYLATVVFNLCELKDEVAERLSCQFSRYDVINWLDTIFSEFRVDSKVDLFPCIPFQIGTYQRENGAYGFDALVMLVFDNILREQGVKDNEIVWLNCDKEVARFE